MGSITFPAPTKGLNTHENLEEMTGAFALVLDNFYPNEQDCVLRPGVKTVSTWGSDVVYIAIFSSHCYIFMKDGIYENGRLQTDAFKPNVSLTPHAITFTAEGGDYFYIVGGRTDPIHMHYDEHGARTWTKPQLTGDNVDPKDFTYVAVHARRLWFCRGNFDEVNNLQVWYLDGGAIAGSLHVLDLGPIFSRGGAIGAIVSFSQDGGAGPQNLCAFFTTKGEIAIYAGTDPSSASTWSLVGVYEIPVPFGKDAITRIGGDVLFLTREGVLSLRELAQPAGRGTLSKPISGDLGTWLHRAQVEWDLQTFFSLFFDAREARLFINMPAWNSHPGRTWVLNVTTGAWCTFSGLRARYFCRGAEVFGQPHLLFAEGDTVYALSTDFTDDDGVPIVANMQTAYTHFGNMDRKHVQMVRPLWESSGDVFLSVGIDVDYQRNPTFFPVHELATAQSAVWNTARWNIGKWAGERKIVGRFYGAGVLGSRMAIFFKVEHANFPVKVLGFDVQLQQGGPL